MPETFDISLSYHFDAQTYGAQDAPYPPGVLSAIQLFTVFQKAIPRPPATGTGIAGSDRSGWPLQLVIGTLVVGGIVIIGFPGVRRRKLRGRGD